MLANNDAIVILGHNIGHQRVDARRQFLRLQDQTLWVEIGTKIVFRSLGNFAGRLLFHECIPSSLLYCSQLSSALRSVQTIPAMRQERREPKDVIRDVFLLLHPVATPSQNPRAKL